MLRCLDALRQYVDNLKRGTHDGDHFGELAQTLLLARHGTPDASASPSSPPPPMQPPAEPAATPASTGASSTTTTPMESAATESTREGISEELRRRVLAAAPAGVGVVGGTAAFQPNLPLVGLKARLLYEKLCNVGDVCHFEPAGGNVGDVGGPRRDPLRRRHREAGRVDSRGAADRGRASRDDRAAADRGDGRRRGAGGVPASGRRLAARKRRDLPKHRRRARRRPPAPPGPPPRLPPAAPSRPRRCGSTSTGWTN